MKPLAVSIYYIIFSENGNNENDKKFDRFDPMSYYNDLSFSNVGAQEVYFPMTRTQVQPSWFWSLEYCRRGHFVFAKNSENPAEIATPAVFWMSPGNYYIYGSRDKGGRSHAWTNCSGARAERMIGSLDRMWPQGCLQLSPEEEVRFTPVYRQMQEYIHTRSKENHHKAVLCMEELLGLLTEIYLREHGQPFVNSKMDILIEKIRFSPLSDYDFKTIAAKEFHMSYSGFRKFFKRINRIAPHEFVMIHRIYYSMELLRNNDLQIQEVAAKCGFNDFSTFSRLFRKKTGLSPSQYRRNRPLP